MSRIKNKTTDSGLAEKLLATSSKDKWKRLGAQRRSGVVVPLFCVYSKNSLGIGDFADLKLLIEWCHESGNSILQLLPMNEMGSLNCPYDSESSFALEPAYISLKEIIPQENKILSKRIDDLRKAFPAGREYIDYAVKNEKIQLLWEIYLEDSDDHSGLKKFKKENAYWLVDFAVFKALKDYYKGLAWYEWEEPYKNHEKASLEEFQKEHRKKVNFQIWLQWQLYKQFREIKDYAAEKKVFIKGDLPIFVSRDSADVWAHREFFKLEFAAGAPPDMYCAKGQRWGMPTYNWQEIAQDNYKYLCEKLKYAENFYDILRVDHVVGLFRVWSIFYNEPMENQGLIGSFDPWDERLWEWQGKNLLNVMLSNSNMLLCAEDLGVIPKVCTDSLRELGIPGNDVARWMKDWNIRHDFFSPQEYRELAVSMLSTHDTTNWPAWWEYEAATVDEALFIRKCNDHGIDYTRIKEKLFSASFSRHGRLRWQSKINSADKLVSVLGQGMTPKGTIPRENVMDFVYMYENTSQEKERLWKQLKLNGKMREKSGPEVIRAALEITLDSSSIFCINLITDLLYLGNILKGDPHKYRFNTPGIISDKNWSLTIPIPLEDLLIHKMNKDIRRMIESSGRI